MIATDTMDQRYQQSMRDFVTASARADSVRESHAGQQSEIHSVDADDITPVP